MGILSKKSNCVGKRAHIHMHEFGTNNVRDSLKQEKDAGEERAYAH